MLSSVGRGREAPPGVDRSSVNWMMAPGLVHKWTPTADTLLALAQEGTLIMCLLRGDPLPENALLVSRAAQAELPDMRQAAPRAFGEEPRLLVTAGSGGAWASGAAAADAHEATPSAKQLEELIRLVAELQVKMSGGGSKKSPKDKERWRRRSCDRRRRRRGGSSSSSRGRRREGRSSSSRGRRRRSCSGSSRSSECTRWQARGRNRKLAPGKINKLGALPAHLLQLVRLRLKGAAGVIRETKPLRDVGVSSYISSGSIGLSGLRDLREAATLEAVLGTFIRAALSSALGVVVTRLQALQASTWKGGGSEIASKVLLVPEPGASVMAVVGLWPDLLSGCVGGAARMSRRCLRCCAA